MNTQAVRFWAALGVVYAVAAIVLVQLEVPSAFLFSGVVAGAVCALRSSDPRPFPVALQRFGLASVGVAAGGQIDADVVRVVGDQPVAVLGCVVATMAVTLACGQLLRLSPHVSGTTAVFASIAGAASGVTAVVREAGGDDAVVMAIQYLRVVAVLVTVPMAAAMLGGSGPPAAAARAEADAWAGLAFTATALALGLALAHVLTFSASRLVLPLLVATCVSVSGYFESVAVPAPILAAGNACIGLMVGLSMTLATVKLLVRLLPLAAAQLVLSLAACAAIGTAFARIVEVSLLDGYLAATPGGLPAVAAIAIASGASVGIVITIQLVRVFLALVLAAGLSAWITRGDHDAPRAV